MLHNEDIETSFGLTKRVKFQTESKAIQFIKNLEHLKTDSFGSISIPDFGYERSGTTVTQFVEFIKGRPEGMLVKKYRDKIYEDIVCKQGEYTFCDFNYENFLVKKDRIYAIDFQSYGKYPLNDRYWAWSADNIQNKKVLDYMTREL